MKRKDLTETFMISMIYDFKLKKKSLTLTVRGSTLVVKICRRQILTSKVYHRTVRIKIFLVVVDP